MIVMREETLPTTTHTPPLTYLLCSRRATWMLTDYNEQDTRQMNDTTTKNSNVHERVRTRDRPEMP